MSDEMTTATEGVSLTDQVRRVHQLREEAKAVKAMVDFLLASFREEHAEQISHLERCQQDLADEEGRLRQMALETFTATNDKRPAPGILVKHSTSLMYKPEEALAWATEHRMCLALDKRAFEKVALASPPPFVLVADTWTPTIATDLGKALGEP